jgi:hypothetical protein
MPLTIPTFDQYQQPMFPLRGLWNVAPVEGDKFVNVEIDWLVTTKNSAVQFSLSGNSPVSLSQIAALAVDNGRCGVDCDFIFPDSGFVLTVPAHNQGVYLVFTNALMFYASAPGVAAGDTTIVQILNSIPPPIPVQATSQQNHASVAGVPLQTNGSSVVLPTGVNGTLNALNINVSKATGGAQGQAGLTLVDGSGRTVWSGVVFLPINSSGDETIPVQGLNVRFINGLNLVINNSTFTGGFVVVNAYYTTP